MTQSALPARLLPTRIKAAHGLGSVTLGIKESGLTTFFMIYYNQVLGFDPRVVSLILIGAMFVDAMVDPLIGRLSDATRTRLGRRLPWLRSEEHTSELQSLMRISYAVFCLKK